MNTQLLKGKMAEAGYTQQKLAQAIGVVPQTLSRKLQGKRQFTVGEALAICEVLHINQDQRSAIFLPSKSQICNGPDCSEEKQK